MLKEQTLVVLSDIHYASEAEKARNRHESAAIDRIDLRLMAKMFRYFIWLRDPHAHNHLLDRFLEQTDSPDLVVVNGDFSVDSAFVGVSDDAACRSVQESLGKLRGKFGSRLRASFGDHELGKMSLFGGKGGLRLASWHRAQNELGLAPFWREELGGYVLMGVTSSLIALPVYEPETLPEERPEWHRLRTQHLEAIAGAFCSLRPGQKVLLFCHDPSALPSLWRIEAVRERLGQVEQTWIGHLHSPLVLWKSRFLSGMPTIGFLGISIRRMTAALNEARHWSPFKVVLCPSLAGTQLFKDGGYYEVKLDALAQRPPRMIWHPIPWH
jgi:hypothetical protein